MLVTIGYGGKRPSDFFRELEKLNADLVIDVRATPQKAFLTSYTKPILERILGRKYVWLPECGNRSRQLPPTLTDEKHCIERIRYLLTQYKTVVLLCAEKDESRCHRYYIKKKVEQDQKQR